MFRVLVVDDEPSAVEYICNIIKVKCPELSVVATAENGEEGLLKFQEFMPDLVPWALMYSLWGSPQPPASS